MSAFPSTRWTLILEAKQSPAARRAALEHLARAYWQPLYVFLRRKGLDAEAARDGVQDVLVQVLERDVLERVTPEKGRLRAYLRTVATHWLINQHEAQVAQKRGAGATVVAFDATLAEQLAADASEVPDVAYERAWAQVVLERAVTALRAEYESGARSGPFEVVALFFGAAAPPSYREVAKAHGLSVPQLKSFLHRARQRLRELVAVEVADTVDDEKHVAAELEAVLAA